MEMVQISATYDDTETEPTIVPKAESKAALAQLLAAAPDDWRNVTVTIRVVGTLFSDGV